VPRVDEIQIAGMLRVDPAVVQRYLEQRIGEPLDLAALDRDLLRAYGDGHYERVDYSVYTTRRGRNVLTVAPVEKSWGPDYLRLALRLDSNLSQGSTYVLRAGYQKTWLNDLGGELLVVGELGNSSGGSVGFYQPLDRAQRWFVDTTAEYRRDRNDYWFQNHRIAEYRSARSRIELVGGINFFLLGQLRAGWRETQVSNSLETGVEIFNAPPNATTPELARAASERPSGGWLLALDIEQADRLYFPRRGWSLQASFFDSTRLDYSRLAVDLRAAWPVQGLVLGTRAAWVGSTRGQLPLTDAARLGGLLNMTGFATGQLLGDDVAFAQLRAERIIGRAPLGLRGDLRLGVALETGRVGVPYGVQSHNGWLQSVAVYLGGESPVGPMFLGVGRGTGGSVNAYLVIGAP
jgi:NTE family protein